MRAALEESTHKTIALPASYQRQREAASAPAVTTKRSALIKGAFSFACFAIALWQGDYWGGKALENLYFKQKSGDDRNTTVSLMQSRADIEIFGDSRGAHHYNPVVIENALGKGMTCHNASRNAQTILYSNAVSKAMLERHSPQAIILDLNPIITLEAASATEKLSVLLPYYDRVPAVRPVIESRSNEQLKLLSHCYRFNSRIPPLLKHTLFPEPSDLKGHSPLTGQLPAHAFQPSPDQPAIADLSKKIDPALEAALREFVERAIAANVKVILVSSPIYQSTFERSAETLALKSLEGLPFERWDYLQDPRFYGNKDKFFDRTHLNAKAAEEFSMIIAERLKTVLLPPFVAQTPDR